LSQKKPATKPASAPSRALADSLLRAGQVDEALRISKEVFTKAPNTENLEHRMGILTRAAEALLDANKPIQAITQEAELLKGSSLLIASDAAWIRTIAGWFARSGRIDEALAHVAPLQDPKDATRLTHLAVDQAVRQKSNSGVPTEHHAGLAAILTAIQNYDAGNDEKARESLQTIGLQSPFLEWKVLLRGLIAYANQDHTRAIENWDRLEASRLPGRLAAPLRLGIDAAYRSSLTDVATEDLQKRSERLMEGNFLKGLRLIQKNLGREGSLSTAFRDAGSFTVTLKRVAPDLFERLSQCFYHAIIHHGQPEDLARYRSTFGPPADDPMFDRLEAIVFEQERIFEAAHAHWQKYANWLAAHPPSWPREMADRARAIVWFRMAFNAHNATLHSNPLLNAFTFFLNNRKQPEKKELKPDVFSCLKHAIDLAPDWSEPSLRLMQSYFEAGQFDQAIQTAREQLDRTPDDLAMLKELGHAFSKRSEFEQAVPIWKKAVALQPLDQELRVHLSYSLLAEIRQKLAKGNPVELRTELAARLSLLQDEDRVDQHCLSATLALKAGAIDAATAIIEQALATPDQRLATAYRLAVDATLASLKPALKTKANKRLKDAFAIEPTPRETAETLRAVYRFKIGGFKYRGEKSHEKQALALVARCLKTVCPPEEYRELGFLLQDWEYWKELQHLSNACCGLFPSEAVFPYLEASAMFNRKDRPHRVEARLSHARRLAQKLEPERKKSLMAQIEDLEKLVAMPFDEFEELDDFEEEFDEDYDDE